MRNQEQRRHRRGDPGQQEEQAEPRRIGPDGPVGDSEQYPGVAGQKQPADNAADGCEVGDRRVVQKLQRRPRQAPVVPQHAQRRHAAEDSEDEESPRANRHGRPPLEHRASGIVLDEHVPEPQRNAQVDDQEDCAQHHADERDVDTEADERAILGRAEETEQRSDQQCAARDAADEEVEDDQPPEVRRAGEECVGRHALESQGHGPQATGHSGHWTVSFATATMRRARRVNAPIAVITTAPNVESIELLTRLRVGSFGSRGRPYASGSSTSRKNAFSPPNGPFRSAP